MSNATCRSGSRPFRLAFKHLELWVDVSAILSVERHKDLHRAFDCSAAQGELCTHSYGDGCSCCCGLTAVAPGPACFGIPLVVHPDDCVVRRRTHYGRPLVHTAAVHPGSQSLFDAYDRAAAGIKGQRKALHES